jgi:hypothetical protein
MIVLLRVSTTVDFHASQVDLEILQELHLSVNRGQCITLDFSFAPADAIDYPIINPLVAHSRLIANEEMIGQILLNSRVLRYSPS